MDTKQTTHAIEVKDENAFAIVRTENNYVDFGTRHAFEINDGCIAHSSVSRVELKQPVTVGQWNGNWFWVTLVFQGTNLDLSQSSSEYGEIENAIKFLIEQKFHKKLPRLYSRHVAQDFICEQIEKRKKTIDQLQQELQEQKQSLNEAKALLDEFNSTDEHGNHKYRYVDQDKPYQEDLSTLDNIWQIADWIKGLHRLHKASISQ